MRPSDEQFEVLVDVVGRALDDRSREWYPPDGDLFEMHPNGPAFTPKPLLKAARVALEAVRHRLEADG